jgi:uncharacterized membrane protein YphA (DoxX/SURF4 family)
MASANSPILKVVGLWIFKILLAIAFVVFGAFKLSSAPMMVHEFDILGLGQWFRYFTGGVEVASAVLLLIPATWRWGALGMLGVSVGACLSQAIVIHGDVIHTIVLILLTGAMSWMAWKPGSQSAANA